jgi:quercetin dioxygenase-like cupin family protein
MVNVMKSIKQLGMSYGQVNFKALLIYSAVLSTGLVVGFANGSSHRQPPAEHEGVSVVPLGQLNESSLKIQLGLIGYEMKLREVTVEPGGAIKEHSHATRPGLVKTISGAWIEVRNGKEIKYPAAKQEALVEDENTVHWLYNDGDVPAVALVCGLSKVAQ